MRQVPNYAIIGNGRMAKHFKHYLNLLEIPYLHWSRTQDTPTLKKIINSCERVLLLISDDAIEPFIAQHPELKSKKLIHFSGAHISEYAYTAHPLMTFSHDYYPLSTYQSIPFIIEAEGLSFESLLPSLPNTSYAIPRADKPLYHALCVLSGNFSCVLWEKTFREMQQRWGLPKSVLKPYLRQVSDNLLNAEGSVLTGPLVRNDEKTLANHLRALKDDPYQAVYQSFIKAYKES